MKLQKKQKNSESEPGLEGEDDESLTVTPLKASFQDSKNTEEDAKIFASSSNIRKCIGCNKLIERKNLIRILKCHKTKQIFLQPDNKTFGRSAYLCYDPACLKEAIKRKRLQKNFKTEILDELLKDLNKLIQHD